MTPQQADSVWAGVDLALEAIKKANQAVQDAIDRYEETLRVARLTTHAAAEKDLAAVTLPAPVGASSYKGLP